MFVFLTRLGRLFVATVVLAGVISILGVMSLTGVLVSHHSAASSAGCTLTGSAKGAPLTLTGSGYSPGATYSVDFVWPNGSMGGVGATANSAGAISVSTYAWWAGTYKAEVFSGSGNKGMMATCSTTIS